MADESICRISHFVAGQDGIIGVFTLKLGKTWFAMWGSLTQKVQKDLKILSAEIKIGSDEDN